MKALLLSISILFITLSSQSQTVLGKWKTIDDDTGKAKSIVEIYQQNGVLYGKVIQLFRDPSQEQDPVCEKCEDYRKGQKIIGMIILQNMKLVDGFYKEGTILDPNNGKIYKCELWLNGSDPNKLELRGYWGWFYRTQTWIRVS
jgi:uncharacterized protein (DUF2147 family)